MDDLPPRASWRVPRPTRWPERARAEGLLEEDVEACPVRVVIEQDGFITGWDEGALGFEEDTFWFSGRACSFRIAMGDLRVRQASGFYAVEKSLAFELRHPTREIALTFEILQVESRNDWEDAEWVVHEIRRLLERRIGVRKTSQYPPLVLRPGIEPIPRVEWINVLLRESPFAGPFLSVVFARQLIVAMLTGSFALWRRTHDSG